MRNDHPLSRLLWLALLAFALHRIEEANVKSEIEAVGFTLAAEGDFRPH